MKALFVTINALVSQVMTQLYSSFNTFAFFIILIFNCQSPIVDFPILAFQTMQNKQF